MVGVYGQEAANRAVGDADTVLIVGAKLSPQDTVRERPNGLQPAGAADHPDRHRRPERGMDLPSGTRD